MCIYIHTYTQTYIYRHIQICAYIYTNNRFQVSCVYLCVYIHAFTCAHNCTCTRESSFYTLAIICAYVFEYATYTWTISKMLVHVVTVYASLASARITCLCTHAPMTMHLNMHGWHGERNTSGYSEQRNCFRSEICVVCACTDIRCQQHAGHNPKLTASHSFLWDELFSSRLYEGHLNLLTRYS